MIHRLEAALQDNRSLSEILNATRRSVLNFSVSVMIAAENGPIPALHSDTGASGTGSSNPACSSRQSVSAVNPEAVGEKPRTLAAFCGWLGT
jgi:hypothetical protein